MKKLHCLFLCLIASSLCKGQVPNTGFETLNPNGSIKNWGSDLLLAFALDSNGKPIDSLILDKAFYFSTNDAHSGSKALEMRNAYWQKDGGKFAGRARLTANDSDYVNFAAPIPVGSNPLSFSFYYKFFPVNQDTALAWLRLTDSSSNIIAEASVSLSGTHSAYTKALAPVIYSSTLSAAFIEIGFIAAKPGSEANYGTRFLVDDLSLTFPTTGIPYAMLDQVLSCFPNPAEKELFLRLKTTAGSVPAQITIVDAGGRQVACSSYTLSTDLLKLNIGELAPGLYFITVVQDGDTYSSKFVK